MTRREQVLCFTVNRTESRYLIQHKRIMQNNTSSKTLDDLNAEQINKLLVPIVYIVILGVIGIVGNLIALVIYGQKYTKSVYGTLIRCLAIVDLAFCLTAIPFNLGRVIRYSTFTELWVCKAFIGVIVFFIHCSSHLLLLLSFHRYRQVCMPLKAQITNKNVRYWICFCCAISAVYTWPHPYMQPLGSVDLGGNLTGSTCPISWDDATIFTTLYNSLLAGIFMLYSTILFTLYSLIARKIYLQRKKITEINANLQGDDLSGKMTKVAFTISAVFTISYVPLYVIKLAAVEINEKELNGFQFALLKMVERLYVVNHVENPFIYAIFDKQFRTQFKNIMRKLFKCADKNKTHGIADTVNSTTLATIT